MYKHPPQSFSVAADFLKPGCIGLQTNLKINGKPVRGGEPHGGWLTANKQKNTENTERQSENAQEGQRHTASQQINTHLLSTGAALYIHRETVGTCSVVSIVFCNQLVYAQSKVNAFNLCRFHFFMGLKSSLSENKTAWLGIKTSGCCVHVSEWKQPRYFTAQCQYRPGWKWNKRFVTVRMNSCRRVCAHEEANKKCTICSVCSFYVMFRGFWFIIVGCGCILM